ncbi:MAG: GAF domain-containing protein [Bradyrhizobium sp.]|uniref:GAF domain-containing protein n=1 Tax=Bradyrhizobium sp. TaxID=376 RepID=UPI00122A9CDF|nr:GAF domain-containing protein [Bradyrhizobium sp.]THD61218.1 MAG: GAF domain-containing protein [Bradyrhizobium sp.]
MAKTKRKAGKGAGTAGRGGVRARKSGESKARKPGLRKLKSTKPEPRRQKPSPRSETARLKRQLKTARMQQEASAEILRAVANASGDVAGPLQQLAETTARLFDASSVAIQLAEGSEFTQEYRVGTIAKRVGSAYPRSNIKVGGRNLPGTVVFESRQIHIPDLDQLDPSMSDFPGLPHARAGGARTVCGTPLRRGGKAIGALIIFRDRLLPFTDDELALLQSFADQAVIAIENARLFNEVETKSRELGEALQQQTATAEVLQVTSNSPGELGPVFRAVLENATRICDARFGTLLRFDGNAFYFAADVGTPAALAEYVRRPGPFQGLAGGMIDRILRTRQVQHSPDYATDAARGLAAKLGGARSTVGVPILRDDVLVGAIVIYRQEIRPFSDREIELVRSFAAQAAIAIENARLFNETKEALERQTATGDVLRIISRSVVHAAPVFDTILESCQRLFNPYDAAVYLVEGDRVRGVAQRGPGAGDWGADSMPLEGSSTGVAIAQRRPLHFPDLADKADLPEDKRAVLKETGGMTVLYAPMISQDSGVGSLVVTRRPKKPFTETGIDFIQSFADQAVIAIENARLFNETKEALERQTATADILKVIASSPADVQPVFDAVVLTARRLLRREMAAIMLCGNDATFRPVAGAGPEGLIPVAPVPVRIDPEANFPSRAIISKKNQHLPDWSAIDLPEQERKIREMYGWNSALYLPMLRGEECIGVLLLGGTEPGSFSEADIALAESFRDQAVIAIENVRLFNETKEALERQTATADILRVISLSPTDVQPVFNTLVLTAQRLLCREMAFILLCENGTTFRPVAITGPGGLVQILNPTPIPINPEANFPSRAIVSRKNQHFPDWSAIDLPEEERKIREMYGLNSALYLPMLRGGECIGVLGLGGRQPGSFSETDMALAESFRDQAVIAIENTRLFNETKEALERQTATSDILNVIAGSPTDTQPVFDAIARSAAELCEGTNSGVFRLRDGLVHVAGHYNLSPEQLAFAPKMFPAPIHRGYLAGRAIVDRAVAHVPDIAADPEYTAESMVKAGFRSAVSVPMFRNGEPIGAINVTREEARPFSDRQIELLRTFADQAVIAIENARLFNETQEALEQQKASAEILSVISHSVAETQPVFDEIVRSIARLFGSQENYIFLVGEDDLLHVSAGSGPRVEHVRALFPAPLDGSVSQVAIRERRLVRSANVFNDPELPPPARERYRGLGENYSMVVAPMLWEDSAIGSIMVARTSMVPFSEKECALLRTFADQAVIAIQNARLFNETREALERQTATSDILNVIASSPTDIRPVFEAIAIRAKSLVGGFSSTVFRFTDGQAHLEAFTPTTPEADEVLTSTFPLPVADFAPFQLAQSGEVVQTPDIEALTDEIRDIGRARGFRSMLFAPLMNKAVPIGLIAVTRAQPGRFAEHHVQLLRTFADQAVIAIGNTRLFDEVQTRTLELAQSLEELRAAQDRLVQTEKLASLGQLTAGIAHEIKNPLNFVNNFSALSAELIDELDETLAPAPLDQKMRGDVGELTQMLKSNLEKVVQHGKRADSIVKNMLLHSREGSGEQRPADINALLDESLNLAYHGARAEKPGFNITLQRDFDVDAGAIELFPQEITRAFLNLISNGFYAASKRKAENGDADFEPVLTAATRNLGSQVEIRIRDNGTGIPTEVREKIFNPFFTTKPAGEGTGLGLSMSHDIIVKQHGGRIEVDTQPGQFTEFTIVLPRATNLAGKTKG